MVFLFRVRQAIRKILRSDNLGNIGTSRMSRTANRKFDISLSGTLLSRSTNLNQWDKLEKLSSVHDVNYSKFL